MTDIKQLQQIAMSKALELKQIANAKLLEKIYKKANEIAELGQFEFDISMSELGLDSKNRSKLVPMLEPIKNY